MSADPSNDLSSLLWPAPDMQARGLIMSSFDVMTNRVRVDGEKDPQRPLANEGRHVCSFGAGFQGQLGQHPKNGVKYSAAPLVVHIPEPVREVACGQFHTAILTSAGSVYTCGDGRAGQLGNLAEGFASRYLPVVVSDIDARITAVACGQFHTLFLSKSGKIYSCGSSRHGQLGHGDRSSLRYPKHITAGGASRTAQFVAVDCGQRHSSAIDSEGKALSKLSNYTHEFLFEVYTWGSSDNGQLGHGSKDDVFAPKQVKCAAFERTKVVQVSSGGTHTAFLLETGAIAVCGFGEHFYRADNEESSKFRYIPEVVISRCPMKKLSAADTFVRIASGQSHILLLTRGGDVWTIGASQAGQTGTVFGLAAVTKHSAVISSVGLLYTWGSSESGQLGHADGFGGKSALDPVLASATRDSVPFPAPVGALSSAVVGSVACGVSHTVVLTSSFSSSLSPDFASYLQLEKWELHRKVKFCKERGKKGLLRAHLMKIALERKQENRLRAQRVDDSQRECFRRQKTRMGRIVSPDSVLSQSRLLPAEQTERNLPSAHVESDMASAVFERRESVMLSAPSVYSRPKSAPFPKRRIPLRLRQRRAQFARSAFPTTSQTGTGQIAAGETEFLSIRQPRLHFHRQHNSQFDALQTSLKEAMSMTRAEASAPADAQERLFRLRSEFDKLKAARLRREHELSQMLAEFDDANVQEETRNNRKAVGSEIVAKIEQKLDTALVQLKEVYENATVYKNNVSHLRDAAISRSKQLDVRRRSLREHTMLCKKFDKLAESANSAQESADMELRDFASEIQQHNEFLQRQLMNVKALLQVMRPKESVEIRSRRDPAGLETKPDTRTRREKFHRGAVNLRASVGFTLSEQELTARRVSENYQWIEAAAKNVVELARLCSSQHDVMLGVRKLYADVSSQRMELRLRQVCEILRPVLAAIKATFATQDLVKADLAQVQTVFSQRGETLAHRMLASVARRDELVEKGVWGKFGISVADEVTAAHVERACRFATRVWQREESGIVKLGLSKIPREASRGEVGTAQHNMDAMAQHLAHLEADVLKLEQRLAVARRSFSSIRTLIGEDAVVAQPPQNKRLTAALSVLQELQLTTRS